MSCTKLWPPLSLFRSELPMGVRQQGMFFCTDVAITGRDNGTAAPSGHELCFSPCGWLKARRYCWKVSHWFWWSLEEPCTQQKCGGRLQLHVRQCTEQGWNPGSCPRFGRSLLHALTGEKGCVQSQAGGDLLNRRARLSCPIRHVCYHMYGLSRVTW